MPDHDVVPLLPKPEGEAEERGSSHAESDTYGERGQASDLLPQAV